MSGAHSWIRTNDLVFTKDVRYQLRHMGKVLILKLFAEHPEVG